MSDACKVRVRLLLARMDGDAVPSVIAAIDETVWEQWTDEDEAAWLRSGKELWGISYDTDFKVVVAEFSEEALAAAFAVPVIPGEVSSGD